MKKMSKQRRKQVTNGLKWVTHAAAILPLLWLFYQWWSWNYLSYPDWNNYVTRFTGKGGIILIILMLAVTPLKTLTNWNVIVPLRKWFGLYAFGYVSVHLLIFVVPLFEESFGLALDEVLRKRYALVGFAAWLIMVPLAITSNKWSQKRLKKRWKRLHQSVYVVSILALIHYFWLVKVGAYRSPAIAAAFIIPLLILRFPTIRKRIIQLRKNVTKRKRAAV